jgi:hypothetical protein
MPIPLPKPYNAVKFPLLIDFRLNWLVKSKTLLDVLRWSEPAGAALVAVSQTQPRCCECLSQMLVPVVLAHREGRLRKAIVKSDPVRVVAVHHVVAPSALAQRLQLQQITFDILADARIGMRDIAEVGY